MPTRDFIVLTADTPAGTEIDIDRTTSAWELTCSACGGVMARDEPAQDEPRDDSAQISRNRFAVKMDVVGAFAAGGGIKSELLLEVCSDCAPGLLGVFLPFLHATVSGKQLAELIDEPAAAVDEPAAAVDEPAAGAVADEPGAVADGLEPGAVADEPGASILQEAL